MAEYLTRDLRLGISATPETSYNGIKVLGTDFLGMLTTGRGFPIPDREKMDDTGKVGYGDAGEFPREQRSGYVLPATMEITDELNTEIAAVLFRRCLGGADPVPAGADILEPATAFRHRFGMLPNTGVSGRQLPSSSMVYALGGVDFVWGGCVVNTFQVSQTGAAVPTFTAGLISSGLNKRIRNITPAFGSVPAPTTQHYMLGAESQLEFTDIDGGPVYSVTGAQRLRSFTLTVDNNHRTDDRRAGDSRIQLANIKKGWYVNRMLHGERTVTAEMTVMLDDDLREYFDADNDNPITGFVYRAKGYYIEDSTVHQYSFAIHVPKCYFRTPRTGDEGGDAVMTLGIFPVTDNATFGLVTAEVINGVATSIV